MSEPLRTVETEVATSVVEVSVVLPCLNEAETLQTCIDKARRRWRRSGSSARSSWPTTGRRTARRTSRESSARGSSTFRSVATARPCRLGSTVPSVATWSWPMPTTATRSSDLGPFVEVPARGPTWSWATGSPGGIAPGAMPPLHRYLGNPVLSSSGDACSNIPSARLPLRHARLPPRRVKRARAAHPGMEFASEMVVNAALTACDIREVPTTLHRTAAAGRRTCAAGGTAGGTCGSCWL